MGRLLKSELRQVEQCAIQWLPLGVFSFPSRSTCLHAAEVCGKLLFNGYLHAQITHSGLAQESIVASSHDTGNLRWEMYCSLGNQPVPLCTT